MIRYTLLALFAVLGIQSICQPFKNNWIDYNKTYYKIPVVAEGLFRIPKTTLTSVNLGTTPAQNFQLWREGEEQPIYTSEASGELAANGYLEFYGRPLDGKQDADLFPNPEYHVYKDLSFFSDTSWYYLTVNSATPNLRFTSVSNDVATTALPADSFFMHTNSINFFRGGFSYNYSFGFGFAPEPLPSQLVVRSSIWDQGEGYASTPFNKSGPMVINMNGLQSFPNGPAMTLFTSVMGSWSYNRTISVSMNDSVVYSIYTPGFQAKKQTITNIPLSRITNDNIAFKYTSDNDTWPERSQANALYLTYPRKFSLANARVFSFTLPANENGNHLRIGKFLMGAQPAVVLDLANNKRYLAVSKGTDSSLVALQPSATSRKLVIANQADFLKTIGTAAITPVTFVDYSKAENQGNYLIITSNRLKMYNGVDQAEAYRQYRASAEGGNFNAKVVDIEQLYDQFAWGVRKNPLGIRRFIQFAAANFAVKPKFVLLMGHSVDYLVDRYSGNYGGREYLNSVPSWGSPSSDNLLAAANGLNPTPLVPIGRLSVVNGKEIGDYLQKLKDYDALAASADYNPEQKAWKKQMVGLVGGDDAYFANILNNFMNTYAKTISDSLYGASVKVFTKVNNPNYPNDLKDLTDRINGGLGILNYFGHSSTSSIDFNVASPDDFNEGKGKFPVFIANGCQAGNMFFISSARLSSPIISISERFVLNPKKGAIAFLSNSDYGLYNYLNIFTSEWMKNAARTNYGKELGVLSQQTVKNAINITGTGEFFNRLNTEQSILHGDPAVALFRDPKPDYALSDSLMKLAPGYASVAEDSLSIKLTLLNLGKAINDSVYLNIKREYPDGSEKIAGTFLLRKVRNRDSVTVKVPIKGIFDKGTNYVVATIDPMNLCDEMSETNNTARVPFEVIDEEVRPVYPYNYSIMNKPGFKLVGSTVNAVQDQRTYRLQVDTTSLFNSPQLYIKDTAVIGGAVSFLPDINWQNGTVYYWRIAPVFSNNPVNWRSSSFQYLTGTYSGWGQSHFYQHTNSSFTDIKADTASRALKFASNVQNLYVINSVYGYSGDEDSHFSISRNGNSDIYSACLGKSIIFNVFDTLTFKPWENNSQRYGSAAVCDWGRQYNFEFQYTPASNRKKIMDFIDSIPKGMIVTARLILDAPFDSAYIKTWLKDTLIYGAGKSLYHSLKNQGVYVIDSMYKGRTFTAVFKKGDSLSLKPASRVSDGLYDRLNTSYFVSTVDTAGIVESPVFGPGVKWREMHWQGHQPPVDSPSEAQVQVIGIDKTGKSTVLKTYASGTWDNDISDIDASLYPYLKLKMSTKNTKQASPYQLDYWRLLYDPVTDGALSALDHFEFNGPVLVNGQVDLHLELAFKNVGDEWLDSASVRITIADRDSSIAVYNLPKTRPLSAGDTSIISFDLPTGTMNGKYYAYVQVNREKAPTEQSFENNSTYIPFEVSTILPAKLLDFTARAEKGNVGLNWNVTNETDQASYTAEHSTSNSISFKAIGSLPAKNTGEASYSLLHTNPADGPNYYRIKMVSRSGKVEYSPIRQVLFSKQASLSLYPNPFRDNIFVNATGGGNWMLEIFSVQGQRIQTQKGSGSSSINTTKLPAGTYMVKITDSHGISTMKFEKHY